MTSAAPGPSAADFAALSEYAMTLADGVALALGPWVERCVRVTCENTGVMLTGALRQKAVEAGADAAAQIAPQVRSVLALDIDDQRVGPLELVRGAVRWPTAVLRDAGIPEVARDQSARTMFPDDVYDLTPGSFRDIDPALHEPGLVWGAAKAHVHLSRRKAAGQR